jgi:cbb3-type cytochrome oxidase maturation protein
MSYLVWLVPIALGMGVVGLVAFFWSMRSGQYDDLEGAAERVLITEINDAPLSEVAWSDAGLPFGASREPVRGARWASENEKASK